MRAEDICTFDAGERRKSMASAMIVRTVQKSASEVTLEAGGKSCDASQFLEMLALPFLPGAPVHIVAEGSDADAVVKAIARLLRPAPETVMPRAS